MRAVYLEEGFDLSESIKLEKETQHHLINVVRLKKADELLLLDGKGGVGSATVEEIGRKDIKVSCNKVWKQPSPKIKFVLGVGQLKKEAMDSVLKSSCELGVSEVIILNSEYSQTYPLNFQRIKKLFISGIEQSNNPFLPTVSVSSLDDLANKGFRESYLFSLKESEDREQPKPQEGENLILIGPEGGFSEKDLIVISEISKLKTIKLDLPIMRAPTAFSCALGHLKAFC